MLLKAESVHDTACVGECYHSVNDYIISAAPDCLFFSIDEVGSYQTTVYSVFTYKRLVGVSILYVGSCSGCGEWGGANGAHPTTQEEILESATFGTRSELIAFLKQDPGMESVPEETYKAVREAHKFLEGQDVLRDSTKTE